MYCWVINADDDHGVMGRTIDKNAPTGSMKRGRNDDDDDENHEDGDAKRHRGEVRELD